MHVRPCMTFSKVLFTERVHLTSLYIFHLLPRPYGSGLSSFLSSPPFPFKIPPFPIFSFFLTPMLTNHILTCPYLEDHQKKLEKRRRRKKRVKNIKILFFGAYYFIGRPRPKKYIIISFNTYAPIMKFLSIFDISLFCLAFWIVGVLFH